MSKRQATACVLVLVAGTMSTAQQVGRFETERDLFLAHFDSKTDVDDIHSIAALATVLANPRYERVSFHAVAGAYGAQSGLYVPSNDLFKLAFGEYWSDAHKNRDRAIDAVSELALRALKKGGRVWIAEAGQSDFTAALIRKLRVDLPAVDLKDRIHVVQHSNWNEEVTTPADLALVKQVATYHKIPDGNAPGNGTPGFNSPRPTDWRPRVQDKRLRMIWDRAIEIANRYNGADGRYLNKSIDSGGLDFSDIVETAWIFGFAEMKDADDFFAEFATTETVNP